MFEKFIGQNIVVILDDNFRKFGKLIKVDNFFICLEFYNGQIQNISKTNIKSIDYDKNTNIKSVVYDRK